ncbi:MAG: DUF418 domain-containing protein [Planctomycetota bacterium]
MNSEETADESEPDVSSNPAQEHLEASAGKAEPVSKPERVESIDVLRGFALLGILLLNIQSFGLISARYLNPMAGGELSGGPYVAWWFTHVLGDSKFMTLFSMLFGAGIVLMWQRARDAGRKFTGLHYRRMFWLVLFGLLHAHLLWAGDILFAYGVTGMLVYWLCGLRARWLLPIGIVWFSVGSALSIFFGLTMPLWGDAELAEFSHTWNPDSAMIAAEIALHRGGYLDLLPYRSAEAFEMETFLYLIWALWRAGGLMLIGMGLFKLGVFSAQRSQRFYALGCLFGFGIGLPVIVMGVQQNAARDWDMMYSFFFGGQFNYWGSVLVSYGYLSLIMLLCKTGVFAWLQSRLAAVGQMALTNYLTHTIVCTTLFNGYGLGWYEKLDRVQLLLVVVTIWILQLIISPLWLTRFRFGPFEWLWRSLSYWKWQPIVRG